MTNADHYSLADDYEAFGDGLLEPATDEEIEAFFEEQNREEDPSGDEDWTPRWQYQSDHEARTPIPLHELIRGLAERDAFLAAVKKAASQRADELLQGGQLTGLTFTSGGTFVLDHAETPTALWGLGQEILLADGESLIIAGDQGLGKTTIAQQLALGMIGVPGHKVLLGYPVLPREDRVLYLAMDRPRQAARSLRRMVTEDDRKLLDERLVIWEGPPPADMAGNTDTLLKLAQSAGASMVFVDSIKDAALGVAKDEVGAGYNRARQKALAAGIQVVELHHNRKAPEGVSSSKPTIADVYGSVWLTAGAGSVVLLTGKPGDPVVGFHHLKQPAEEVGPFDLIHDHTKGHTEVHQQADLVGMAHAKGHVTAQEAACALFGTTSPTEAQLQKARRRLDKLSVLAKDTTTKPHAWRIPDAK